MAGASARPCASGKQKMSDRIPFSFKAIARPGDDPLLTLQADALMPLPVPTTEPALQPPKPAWVEKFDMSLDGHSDFDIPKPQTPEEEQRLVNGFLSGLQKLFDPQSNWPFVKLLKLSMDYCVRCQTCSEACHVYRASGRQEIYRPTFRSEVLR